MIHIDEIKLKLMDNGYRREQLDEILGYQDELDHFLSDRYANTSIMDIGKKEIAEYAAFLLETKTNNQERITGLRDLANSLGNRPMFIALTELLDGCNIMTILEDEVRELCGAEICKEIFTEENLLGTDNVTKCEYTRKVMKNIRKNIPSCKYRDCLTRVRHGMEKGNYDKEREKYLNCGSLNAYLELKRNERDSEFLRLKNENELYHTMVITDEVFDLLKGETGDEIGIGRREGNYIYFSKIPYEPVKYIKETGRKKKAYYMCHCSWVRESIISEEPVHFDFCYCSLGHAKRLLEGVLQHELQGEIIESALRGDARCRFQFRLPEGIK